MHATPKRLPVLIAALALVALPLVHAAHGGEHCYTTSTPEVTLAVPAGATLYVDNDANPDFWTLWIYEESNGIAGLQRDDEIRTDFSHCEWVQGDDPHWLDHDGSRVRGDTIIF